MAAADLGPLDRLVERAETLSGAWSARANASTTVGRERAILRLLGVGGLDRAQRPLAWAVVDRHVRGSKAALGGGLALPFSIALLEYDVSPQQLALDVAAGTVDLAAEAELLTRSDRRAVAEEEARRLIGAAFDRIDANRTARRELVGLIGSPPLPWIGVALGEPDVEEARANALRSIAVGADVVRVEVPIGRELISRLQQAGVDAPVWRSAGGDMPVGDGLERAPAGSQRALAELRRAVDQAAAERRSYVRIGLLPPALGGPEAAVVAAFERVDLVESDPLWEIVAGRVDPDRALADHAFAHRLLARAGVTVAIGAGPLVVAPELASGRPSDAATRAGRALGLQLLAIAIARRNGVPADQLVVGALPPWLTGEPDPASRAAGEIALRRALHPELPLVFEEPLSTAPAGTDPWAPIVAAVQPPPPETGMILRRRADAAAGAIAGTRSAARIAAEITSAFGPRTLAGTALEHARASAAAALVTLDRLADEGWRSVLGDPPDAAERLRLGADAVAERTEAFDPLARVSA